MNLIKTFGLLSGLSGTYRFANAKLINRESVLEHLGGITLMCLLIYTEMVVLANKIERLDSDVVARIGGELGEVLARAICHDIEEAITGDVPRTIKHRSAETREAFFNMGSDAVDQISEDLDLEACVISDYWHSAKSDDLAGMIVRLADVLAVVYTIHGEAVERGNRAMMSRATTVMGQLDACAGEFHDAKFGDSAIKEWVLDLIGQAKVIVALAKATSSEATLTEDQM